MARTQTPRHGEEHDRIGYVTQYGGVEFKSQLEADFARALDRAKIKWTYEPRVFGPRRRKSLTWVPDFFVSGVGYVELKPADLTPKEIARQIRRIAVAWESDPDVVVQLVIWKWGEGAVIVFTGVCGAWLVNLGYPAGVIHPWPATLRRVMDDSGKLWAFGDRLFSSGRVGFSRGTGRCGGW